MPVDLQQFHAAFFDESAEAIDTMEAALLRLAAQDGSADKDLIHTVFRVAHSIKGGSATFGFQDVASFTHSLETLLDELRSGRMDASQAAIGLLLRSVDVLRAMFAAMRRHEPCDPQLVADLQFDIEVSVAQHRSRQPLAPGPAMEAGAPRPEPTRRWHIDFRPGPEFLARGHDPLRVLGELGRHGRMEVHANLSALPALRALDTGRAYLGWQVELEGSVARATLEDLFAWVEGDCHCVLTEEPLAVSVAAAPAVPEAGASMRVSITKVDALMDALGELVVTQELLRQAAAGLPDAGLHGTAAERLREGLGQLERNVRILQEDVLRMRLLPIGTVFGRLPRMVHDLAARLGKQVELQIVGEQTELDRTVLEKIGDPLVHLVRNCIDHGCELPDARRAAGKPAAGVLRLQAAQQGSSVIIEVSDDGAGLDRARILARARSLGLPGLPAAGDDEAVAAKVLHELIFRAGFSTAERTTDVSGRGVGMDVVRRNVQELGGTIDVSSEAGRGTRFRLVLPLTLAILEGQSVAVGAETYLVPVGHIVESVQVERGQIGRVPGRGEVLRFRDGHVPVLSLGQIFGVEPRSPALERALVIVVEGDGRRAGLLVDALLGQQQVVVKPLETHYHAVGGIAGATLLGDGSVALILDVPGLIRAVCEPLAA